MRLLSDCGGGLQDETGAMIDVNRDTNVITIRGSDSVLVQTAVERVKALLADTPAESTGAGGSGDGSGIEKRVTVDKRSIAGIIGPGGATVRQLQDDSGARISIDRVCSLVVCILEQTLFTWRLFVCLIGRFPSCDSRQ